MRKRKLRPAESQREAVAARAGGLCEYCRCPDKIGTQDRFSAEHIVPESAGGATVLENLAYSCQACNNHKFTAQEAPDPETGLLAPLFHPRLDRWADHFAWAEDKVTMLGLTPTGRATISRLQINREPVVGLRTLMLGAGKHPPAEPQ